MIKLQAAWAVLSSAWEKVLPFVIKHWKILLILALSAALFLKMRSDYRAMETAYQARLESSEAQLEGLKVIHETQLREQQLLMESFLESIAAIEEEYEKTREELEKERNRKIDKIEREFNNENYEESISDVERLKEKLRKFRKCGLEQGGEYSPENLAFKALRRNGYLEKLSRFKIDSYDKIMSL